MSRNKQLFKIPEEAILNEHGLVVPPKPIICSDYPEQHEQLVKLRPDRHHIYWERKSYQKGPYKELRTNPRFIIKLCRHFHDELHAVQEPVKRPSRHIARLAVQQAEIEHHISEKYQSIESYVDQLGQSIMDISEKQIESIVDRLSDEIDELKENLGLIFGDECGVIPTQQYYIDGSGSIVLEDIPVLY